MRVEWVASPDIQTDSNLGISFQRARGMHAYLLTRRTAWQPLVLFALLPMVLALMMQVPIFGMLRELRHLIG